MDKSTSGRCGYEWPSDCDRVDVQTNIGVGQSCCFRKTVNENIDRCIWHADPNDVGEKTIDDLVEARTTKEVRELNTLSDELLDGVSLSECVIENLSLSHTTLRGANLTNATLTNADLTGADLWEANLTDANVLESDLTDALLFEANLTSAELLAVDLTGAYLGRANLTGANIPNVDLTDAELLETNLTDANLRLVELNGRLERANLTRTNLFDADLRGAEFHGAVMTDAQINEGTEFGDHYTTDGEIEKAAWSLSQIEELSRQNALPDQIREAFTKRKDRRRQHYYQNSKVPGWLRLYVTRVKAASNGLSGRLRNRVQNWANADEPLIIRYINVFADRLYGNDEASSETNSGGSDGTGATEDGADGTDESTEDTETTDDDTDDSDTDLTNYQRYVYTARWAWLALSGAIMRYGESARRVVTLSLLTILTFGVAYPFVGGIEDGGTVYTIQSTSEPSVAGLVTVGEVFLRNLYFSTITFTTIGYANVAPAGPWSRLLVGIESFAGALLMALLVFVLGRRSTR